MAIFGLLSRLHPEFAPVRREPRCDQVSGREQQASRFHAGFERWRACHSHIKHWCALNNTMLTLASLLRSGFEA